MRTSDGIHEVFEGDVQYPYADIGSTELLHISSVTKENRREHSYICPYCKKALTPRLGKYRTHCFAHKKGESCELDRYIHKTAEELLEQKWKRDEPFEITMKVRYECENFGSCFFCHGYSLNCVREEIKTFDLKKWFTQCLVEKKVGEFIPDLCLIDESGEHDPIFIEIWSKHKNSEKKAESNNKIIEIRLKTTAELEALPKHPITESETVTFNHFKTLKKETSDNDGPKLMRYTLYADTFKSFVDEQSVNCHNYRSNHHPKAVFEVVCSKDEVYQPIQLRYFANALAINRGYDIRLCYLCEEYGSFRRQYRYGDDPFIDRTVGCRRIIDADAPVACKQEDARSCPHFKINESQLKMSIDSFNYYTRYIWQRNADGTVSEEYLQRSF